MKKLILSFLIINIISCTKIINVDLNTAESNIVIEAEVSNTANAHVAIKKSVPFSNSNQFPAIENALVTITENGGNEYKLTQTAPGIYQTASIIGFPGKTYQLNINIDGKNYQSVGTMPAIVTLDSLILEKIPFIEEPNWIVKPMYTDPPGFGNQYRFIQWINGKRHPNIWVWDDKLTNDGISTRPLIQADSIVNINDTVEVEMQCIDWPVYRYFRGLQDLQRGGTTPANPESNISGGALGYFNVHTKQRKKRVVNF